MSECSQQNLTENQIDVRIFRAKLDRKTDRYMLEYSQENITEKHIDRCRNIHRES